VGTYRLRQIAKCEKKTKKKKRLLRRICGLLDIGKGHDI
jgi:hypothetical protein